ncbi:ABC transporter permease [Actinoallomurus purpureus]|uniref:ABC transporter permease n=1 Tax=Actinoallomurus purpureus TaxID=478114 RepID=UPI002093C7D4|nr:ABC transporter permease [Actinoallomurus purpureus]MCO6003730.1 ABC transporter permease [Actinoallomurus purpureus]
MSVLQIPTRPVSVAGRLRWALADGWTVVRRNLAHLKSQPGQLIAELVFPAVMVLMFGYVFGSAIPIPGGGNYREYLMPGLFGMTAFTGVLATATVVAQDAGRGVMDRFRSMPMARSAVPFGQTGADIITGALAMAGMVVCGFAIGWRPHEGPARTMAAFGLLVLLRYAISWGGVLLGLMIKEETLDKLVPLIFPITMVSNSFVPTGGMPTWLRVIADWNPVSAIVAACRDLFGSPGTTGSAHLVWPLAHPVVATLLWSIVLLVLFVPASVHRYRTVDH